MKTLICLLPFMFLLTLRFLINLNTDKKNDEIREQFWAKERKARFARNKDISDIELFTPELSALPFHDNNRSGLSDEALRLEEQVIAASKEPMLDLHNMSNADIKIAYGVGNFPTVSGYDQNYLYFTRSVFQWGKHLYDNKLYDDARTVLEYVITLSDEMTLAYTMLGSIYLDRDEIQLITRLIHKVEASGSITSKSTCNTLRDLINNY